MKRNHLIVIIFGALALAAAAIIGSLAFFGPDDSAPAQNGTNPFGFADGTGTSASSTLRIALVDGTETTVPDFTKESQPSWASVEAGYQVGGSDESAYQILYFPENSGFLISLLKEPLGENRRHAERELKAKLGLSEAELCKLQAQVATSIDVNETYAGQELGLSFCVGAIELP
jgi:hypothetical protein